MGRASLEQTVSRVMAGAKAFAELLLLLLLLLLRLLLLLFVLCLCCVLLLCPSFILC